jgi:protein involved in polysaccharide export with SLBB domain
MKLTYNRHIRAEALVDRGAGAFGTMLSSIRLVTAVLLIAIGASGTADAAGRQLVASDMVQIKVVGQSELDTQARIDNDGTITFPFLGRVQAAGASEDELSERIKQGLINKGIVKRPQVIVSTVEAGVYYLGGYVNKPGQYPLTRRMTVLQAIAAGGGIAPLGSEYRVKIVRRMPDAQILERDAKLTDDVEPDDTVYVNERLF